MTSALLSPNRNTLRAIKDPYRRFNWFEALGQMLMVNQRLNKLAAARSHFEDRGMFQASLFSSVVTAAITR